MAGNAKKGSTLPQSNGIAYNDCLIVITSISASPNNYLLSLTNLFANSNVSYITVGNNALSTANLIVRSSGSIPANSSSSGVQGQIVWDSGHIYVCVSNNSWLRAALTTF